MRISDWSSDVCSSDLAMNGDGPHAMTLKQAPQMPKPVRAPKPSQSRRARTQAQQLRTMTLADLLLLIGQFTKYGGCRSSEEHKSELPSPMRISYAVFCF